MRVCRHNVGNVLRAASAPAMHRAARIYLLCCLLLPLLLPLIHLPLSATSPIAYYRLMLPEVTVNGYRSMQGASGFTWVTAFLWTYGSISVLLALAYLAMYLRLFARLRKGSRVRHAGYSISIQTGIGPGTAGRHIFFPGKEIEAGILRHELAHIRAGHRFDAALSQPLRVVFWISPAHWMISRELKIIHEFEADSEVARSMAVADYSALLLSQSLGVDSFPLAHSFFHHPLKRRIKMLQLSGFPNRRLGFYLLAGFLVIIFSGAVLFAQVKKRPTEKKPLRTKQVVSGNDTITMTSPGDIPAGTPTRMVVSGNDTIRAYFPEDDPQRKKTPHADGTERPGYDGSKLETLADGRVVYTSVEKMPAFNGSMGDWLGQHLHYPDSARAHGQQGRSIIQFVVDEHGHPGSPALVRSSGSALLDVEALRIVGQMPRWNPGELNGQKVLVMFTLPVTFKLD